jgi:hypothetical protein
VDLLELSLERRDISVGCLESGQRIYLLTLHCQNWVFHTDVRAEGERRVSRLIVTSVALSGFVGVVNALVLSTPTSGHVACGLDTRLRRPAALGRPLAIILHRNRWPKNLPMTSECTD